jgi:type IV secretion system protein VirB9
VSFLAQDNHLFLKPKAAHLATNLTLLTSERTYHIDYSVSGRSPELNPGSLIYSLTFLYPAEEAQQAAIRAAASKLTDDLRAPTDRRQRIRVLWREITPSHRGIR